MIWRAPAFVALLVAAMPAVGASPVREVEVRVVPPQPVQAISVRSGEETRAVVVRKGKALIPAELKAPWSLQMTRFEADVYTAADLEAKRPWVIRELGILRGKVERRQAVKDARYAWLLADGKSDVIRDIEFALDERDAFEIRVAAGTYHGAILGPGCGTRIRSGIIVKPGEVTEVGTVAPESAVPVSLRVLDAAGKAGVAGARLIWDPAGDMLNSDLSRRLYARRWSAVTDRTGAAVIRFVGPVPHSARWRIEAKGFAPARTASSLLKEPLRFAMPDVRLRPEPSVVVRVYLPRRDDRDELEGAALVAGEIRDPRSLDFVPVHRVPLRDGETTFRFGSYGTKRVWVDSAAGKKLVFQEFKVTEPASNVDFVLRKVEISGRVTHDDKGVEGSIVSLAEPVRAQHLAQVTSDSTGGFRFRTWATGEMRVYTIPPRTRSGPGKVFGSASEKVDLTGKNEVWIDLKIPKAGFGVSVVDAETSAPVKARFVNRAHIGQRSISGIDETDEQGKFDLSGYPDGTATLHVTAKGYRSQIVTIPISTDHPEVTVRMQRAKPSGVRVVDLRGTTIRGATVIGGFENEHEDPFYSGTTDANGRVEFDPPPPVGTMFYVAAGGYALGMIAIEPERDVTVTLHPPSASILTLRQNNMPPEKTFLVMAAPAGREFIPLNAIEELAEANGMNLYQISGSSPTGEVVLPEFLGPGTYDLFLARRGGRPFLYEKFGTIRTPLARNAVFAVKTQ